MIFQGQSLASMATILDSGFSIESGFADFDTLMSRGGLQSMLLSLIHIFGGGSFGDGFRGGGFCPGGQAAFIQLLRGDQRPAPEPV